MTATVTKNAARERYLLLVDGEERGYVSYVTSPTTIELPHTVVDPELRGSGLGAKLVQSALDDIRDTTELRVIPTCPFVAKWILKHPEYQDLTRR